MKKITYPVLLLAAILLPAHAKLIDNSAKVKAYYEQLEPTQKLVYEVQETLIAGDAIYSMYKNLGALSPEVPAVGRHLMILKEQSDELFGNPAFSTHFLSCAKLARHAGALWDEKLFGISRDNTKNINITHNEYIKFSRECNRELSTPPPNKIEESDELVIIDVTE